ncbi:MAG TPA: YceI family protein [Syntrophorhabdales bacterium]|nr:YceI family protein [Syntrophorhabdales bacterium]
MAKFVLDPDHTAAEFTIRHMMVTWVSGHFSKVSGTLYFDPLRIAESSVEAVIDVASICTGVEKRDEDLRSPNYFDAEKYPKITFKSARVEYAGMDHCLVHGDLTIRSVTRPATLDVRYAGPSHFQDDDRMYTTFGFQATTRVNREDFGMLTNMELEHGGFMVGKYAYLTLNAEADLVEE